MKKELMIKAIYEKMADKALSFGCKTNLGIIVGKFHLNNNLFFALKVDYNTSYYEYIDDNILNAKHQNYIKVGIKYYKYINSSELLPIEPRQLENNKPISFTIYPDNFKIIGHPVKLGEVLDYIKNNIDKCDYLNTCDFIIGYWKEKRKPLEMQSDDCIKYIYNLIK